MRIQSNNRYSLIDNSTGEVIKLHEGDKIIPQTQILGLEKRQKRQESHIDFESVNFVKVDREYLKSEKNRSERLLSEVIFSILRYDGSITANIKKLSVLSGLSRQTVSRTLKVLEEKNIIWRDGKIIYVNPWIALRGRVVDMRVLVHFMEGGDGGESGHGDGDSASDDDGA